MDKLDLTFCVGLTVSANNEGRRSAGVSLRGESEESILYR